MEKSPKQISHTTQAKKAASFFARCVNGSLKLISLCCVGGLWCSAASALISPEHCRYLSLLALAFPVFLVATIGVMLLSLIINWRKSWITFVGLALCAPTIHTYCPINLPSTPSSSAIKVMTFNTHGFGQLEPKTKVNDEADRNIVAKFIMDEAPDLVGYQEGIAPSKFKKHVAPLLKEHGYYADSVSFAGNRLGCFSKFKIIDKEILCPRGGNGVAVFKVLRNPADTLHFIVAHLQTMKFSSKDKTTIVESVQNLLPDETETTEAIRPIWHVLRKMAQTSIPRAEQATALADYIERNAGQNIIVCGDFNETPVSYTYRTILNAGNLEDAFVESGNGVGRSYNQHCMYVRIDHILYAADHWDAHGCRVHKEPHLSDHYAITTYLDPK